MEIQFIRNGKHGGVSMRKKSRFVLCPERMPHFCKNYSERLNAEIGQNTESFVGSRRIFGEGRGREGLTLTLYAICVNLNNVQITSKSPS